MLNHLSSPNRFFGLFGCFLRQGFSVYLWLSQKSQCSPDWSWTQRLACLCFHVVGLKVCTATFCFAFVFPRNFFKDNVFFSKEDKRFDSSNDATNEKNNPRSLPACLIIPLPPGLASCLQRVQSYCSRVWLWDGGVRQLPLPGVSADGCARCTVWNPSENPVSKASANVTQKAPGTKSV